MDFKEILVFICYKFCFFITGWTQLGVLSWGVSSRILLTIAALRSNTESVRVGGESIEPGENGFKNAEFLQHK